MLNRGESYIEDVPATSCSGSSTEHGLRATTDYDELRDADAILIALPTPLSKQREPDLSIVNERHRADREAAPRRPRRRARVDDLSGHDARRGAAAPGGVAASGSARTSTSRSRRSASIPAARTGRRRTSRRSSAGSRETCTERAAAVYEGAVDTVHRVSSPESAELTKLLENIFRSVNIALVNELAQLCERMKIDLWEVVDAAATKPFGFMSFKPGPGPRRALHPDRPVLPHLEGAGVRLLHRVHRARRQGEREHAVPLPLAHLAGAEPRQAAVALEGEGARARASRTSPEIADTRESPALKLIELLQAAGADVSYHDPHVPRLDGLGLASVPLEPERFDCIAIVTDHRGIDYEALVDERRRDRRLPERDRREGPQERQGLEAVTQPGGPGRPRLLGPEPRAELRRSRRPRLALRPRRRAARTTFADRYPAARMTADFDELLADPELDAVVDRDAGADALRARPARARGRQARLRREAAGDEGRGDGRARRARRGARPRPDARPPAALPPGRAQAEGARRRRRARRGALRLHEPPEPRDRAARTRTRSGRSACTTSR